MSLRQHMNMLAEHGVSARTSHKGSLQRGIIRLRKPDHDRRCSTADLLFNEAFQLRDNVLRIDPPASKRSDGQRTRRTPFLIPLDCELLDLRASSSSLPCRPIE